MLVLFYVMWRYEWWLSTASFSFCLLWGICKAANCKESDVLCLFCIWNFTVTYFIWKLTRWSHVSSVPNVKEYMSLCVCNMYLKMSTCSESNVFVKSLVLLFKLINEILINEEPSRPLSLLYKQFLFSVLTFTFILKPLCHFVLHELV